MAHTLTLPQRHSLCCIQLYKKQVREKFKPDGQVVCFRKSCKLLLNALTNIVLGTNQPILIPNASNTAALFIALCF